MTDVQDKILEHLRLLSSQYSRLELKQAEIATRLSSLERIATNNEAALRDLMASSSATA